MNHAARSRTAARNATRAAGVAVAAALTAVSLVACDSHKDRCHTQPAMFYSVTDHHYHYGSPTGSTVPAAKVPSSAAKVPGYKAPAAPKVPAVKAPALPRAGKR